MSAEKRTEHDSVFIGTEQIETTADDEVQKRLSRQFYFFAFGLLLVLVVVTVLSYVFGSARSRDRRSYADKVYDDRRITDLADVLHPSEKPYYLVFYTANCEYCETVKGTVLDYLEDDKNFTHDLYLSDLEITIDPEMQAEQMIGIREVEDLKIPGYPTMLEIEDAAVKAAYIGTAIIGALTN